MGGVAREQSVHAVSAHEHSQVSGGMAGKRDEDQRSVACEVVGDRKRSNPGSVEVDDARTDTVRPAMRDVAAQVAADSLRPLPLDTRDDDLGLPERGDVADVVGVEVRKDDPPDGGRVEATSRQLGGELVAHFELEARRPQEGMPALVVAGRRSARRLARIEQAEADRMLDGERPHGQRVGAPASWEIAQRAVRPRLRADAPRLEGVRAEGRHRRRSRWRTTPTGAATAPVT